MTNGFSNFKVIWKYLSIISEKQWIVHWMQKLMVSGDEFKSSAAESFLVLTTSSKPDVFSCIFALSPILKGGGRERAKKTNWTLSTEKGASTF